MTPTPSVDADEDWRRVRAVLVLVVEVLKGAMVELKGTKKGRLASVTRPNAERMVGLPPLRNGVRVSVSVRTERRRC